MESREFEELIHGHIDGKLDHEPAAAFHDAVDADAERKRRVETEEKFAQKLRETLRPQPAPAELRSRVKDLIRDEYRPRKRRRVFVFRSRTLQTVTAAAAALLLVIVGRWIFDPGRNPDGSIPTVIQNAVALFDDSVQGATLIESSTIDEVPARINYPSPPVITGALRFVGYSHDGNKVKGLPNPCFIYRGQKGDLAFFCLGDRLRGDALTENGCRTFDVDGYRVVCCGTPGSFHIWITKLDRESLEEIIHRDHVPASPWEGIKISISNLDCWGCADRAGKMLEPIDGVEQVRASVRDNAVYVRPSKDDPELRRKLVARLKAAEFDAR